MPLIPTFVNVATPFVPPSVKISQVYGGGGNSGATYTNDFVELFNSGTTPVDVANWSVQVAVSLRHRRAK